MVTQKRNHQISTDATMLHIQLENLQGAAGPGIPPDYWHEERGGVTPSDPPGIPLPEGSPPPWERPPASPRFGHSQKGWACPQFRQVGEFLQYCATCPSLPHRKQVQTGGLKGRTVTERNPNTNEPWARIAFPNPRGTETRIEEEGTHWEGPAAGLDCRERRATDKIESSKEPATASWNRCELQSVSSSRNSCSWKCKGTPPTTKDIEPTVGEVGASVQRPKLGMAMRLVRSQFLTSGKNCGKICSWYPP